jgi:hypothetical protein
MKGHDRCLSDSFLDFESSEEVSSEEGVSCQGPQAEEWTCFFWVFPHTNLRRPSHDPNKSPRH